MIHIGNVYRFSIPKTDSAWIYFQKAVDINRKLKSPQLQILIGNSIAGLYNATGNYPEALKLALETLKLAEQIHDTSHIFFTKREIMWTYRRIGDHQKELALAKDLHDFAISGYFKWKFRCK